MTEKVVISRKEAMEAGLDRYWTGKPCKHGHVAERYVSSKGCVTCAAEQGVSDEKRVYNARWWEANRDARRVYRTWHREEYPGRARSAVALGRISKSTGVPPWVRSGIVRDQIDSFYASAGDLHVDHIVAIRGITEEGYEVWGLHVSWNLQYLTQAENIRKRNRVAQSDAIDWSAPGHQPDLLMAA